MPEEESREELEKKLDGVRGITIPVNYKIEGKHRVLDFTELEMILRSAELISQSECQCRKGVGDEQCMEPMDGCFGLNAYAKDDIERITVSARLRQTGVISRSPSVMLRARALWGISRS